MRTYHDIGTVVVKDSWDVVLRKGICCVADEHARLADRTCAQARGGQQARVGGSQADKAPLSVLDSLYLPTLLICAQIA